MTGLRCQFCGAALESLTVACPFCAAQPVLGDRYELRQLIGRGGMGEVFLGYDRRLQNDVAIKRLTPQLASSAELRDSLTKEARIMARLSDSHIVRLFDLTEFFGDLYLILEYVCGPSLRDMIRSGYRATPVELAKLMEGICQGLGVAHHDGVIHRDLKPSNLLLALEGADREAFRESRLLPEHPADPAVKITDFGMAKAIADSGSTLTNAFSGTPGYMAPEQFRGEQPSPETDVYALGAITCELLTGKLPASPLRVIEGVHPAVTEVVVKAMSPQRAMRFSSAAAFYDALCNAIEGRSPRRAPLRPARPGLTRKQLAMLLLVAAIFAVLLILLIPRHAPRQTRLTVLPNFEEEKTVIIDWHSPPRAAEPPPVIEDARGQQPETGLSGPAHPRIKWTISLNLTGSLRIAALGTDGTAYITSFDEVCAIRDGKVVWAYKVGLPGASDVHLDRAGRLWFHTMNSVYCFNRDGQGGRLPAGANAPPGKEDDRFGCSTFDHSLYGPNWKMELDGECGPAELAHNGQGGIYASTDRPQILALTRNGKVQWQSTPACTPADLVATLPNRLVYACKNRSLHGMLGSSESWETLADGELENAMLADNEGNVYYGDHAAASHLHSIDPQGRLRWTVDLNGVQAGHMVLDNRRQLFVSASGFHYRLLCLGD